MPCWDLLIPFMRLSLIKGSPGRIQSLGNYRYYVDLSHWKRSSKLIHVIPVFWRTRLTSNVKWEFYLSSKGNQQMTGRGNFWQMNKWILGTVFWLGASKYYLVILTLPPKKMEVKYNCHSPSEDSHYLQDD